MTSLRLLCSALFFATVPAAFSAGWTPDPSLGNPDTHRRLYEIGRRYLDENFDPAANLVGTPSHNPPNKKSHTVRESAYYVYGLLLTGDPDDRTRAQAILRNVLAAQDTRPGVPSQGAFLWYAEDKWEALQNPDLNSAAFVGLTLAQIADLDRKKPCLDPDLRGQVEAAGKLAVQGVLRRNVDPGYTNIATLSTAVAAAGAKLWGMPEAAKFAEDKIDSILGLAGDGGDYEYLSPTYGGVDVYGAYAAQQFAFSDVFAGKAKALIDHYWKQFAGAYDATTYQLVGPYCRSYGEDMLTHVAVLKYFIYLALDGAYPLPDTETDHVADKGGLVALASMPVKPRPEFKEPPAEVRQIVVAGPPDGAHPTRHLTQYRTENFALGTVAFQDEWKQKRNLVAHWRSAAPAPENFRIGYCLDESNETLPGGYPMSKAHFYSKQAKGAALVALATATVPAQGSNSLVFPSTASLASGDGAPFRVQDGDYTAYVYPVSPASARYEGKGDEHHFKLERPWASADVVGSLHVLSYVVVFRPSAQPAPAVSDLTLVADADGVTASAQVDGEPLSVSFKN